MQGLYIYKTVRSGLYSPPVDSVSYKKLNKITLYYHKMTGPREQKYIDGTAVLAQSRRQKKAISYSEKRRYFRQKPNGSSFYHAAGNTDNKIIRQVVDTHNRIKRRPGRPSKKDMLLRQMALSITVVEPSTDASNTVEKNEDVNNVSISSAPQIKYEGDFEFDAISEMTQYRKLVKKRRTASVHTKSARQRDYALSDSNIHIDSISSDNAPAISEIVAAEPINNAPINNVPISHAPINNAPINNAPINDTANDIMQDVSDLALLSFTIQENESKLLDETKQRLSQTERKLSETEQKLLQSEQYLAENGQYLAENRQYLAETNQRLFLTEQQLLQANKRINELQRQLERITNQPNVNQPIVDNTIKRNGDNHIERNGDNHIERNKDNHIERNKDTHIERNEDTHIERNEDTHIEEKYNRAKTELSLAQRRLFDLKDQYESEVKNNGVLKRTIARMAEEKEYLVKQLEGAGGISNSLLEKNNLYNKEITMLQEKLRDSHRIIKSKKAQQLLLINTVKSLTDSNAALKQSLKHMIAKNSNQHVNRI